MEKQNMKQTIHTCICTILDREQKEYAKLNEIYEEVASYLEVENNKILQSQIRGRLQECCEQYKSFLGDDLFLTEKIKSGNWTVKSRKKVSKRKYIRYLNNTFLITNNNWTDIEMVKSISDQYVLDDNLDNIYKAKLMQLIGKDKANIIIGELNTIRKLLRETKNIDRVNDGYGIAFEVFAISVIYNISYEECIDKYIVHGNSDGKIDAIFYGELDNIYIYQIKTGDITDDVYNVMNKNYDDCSKNKIPNNGKDLFEFYKNNNVHFVNKRINFRSVSSNSKKKTNTKPLEIYDKFFKNRLLPLNNNNLTLSINKPTIKDIIGNSDDTDEFQYNVSRDYNNNYIFYISAKKLIDYLLIALGINPNNYGKDTVDISKYFSDNVRGVLSVNKKMIYTIENEPENFVKYNNGISITGEVMDLGNKINIKNPIINNGQQTVTTLIRMGINLDKIMVSVKITNENNMIVKGKISQYSNEQVKVKSIDMLSLNSYIRKIQSDIFESEYNNNKYFLEIYSSGKKSYCDIITKLYKRNNIIELSDFIKLYFSIQNNKTLGMWKNNINMQIERTPVTDYFDKDLAFRVCEATALFENYMDSLKIKKEKDDLQSADLAFKYLLCKERLSVEEATIVINRINRKYYYNLKDEKSKLIDIYKSPTIINKLEDELELFKKDVSKNEIYTIMV